MDMDEYFALFREYIEVVKREFNYIRDMYPADVQEGYEIMFQVGEMIADPGNDDQTLREAIFNKIPREKIKWAVEVTSNWKSEDEQRAEAREKERQRRQRNKRMEERELTEEKNDELYENFDTSRILEAVDALDEVREVISDQFNESGFPSPPAIRDRLLMLHKKANEIINGEFSYDTDLGMFDLAWEIEEAIFDAISSLEKIQQVIHDLTNLTPSDE